MVAKGNGMRFAVEISFLVLVFSLGFMQPNVEVRGITVPVTDLLFLASGAIWSVALLLRKVEFRFDRIYWLFGLYAAALLLSALLSENPRSSLFRFLGELYLIGLAVMTFNIVRTPEMLKKAVFVWLASSAAVAAIGTSTVISFYLGSSNFVTQFSLHNYGTLPAGNYPRLQGTFVYPSMLCNYLTVSLLMLLAAWRLRWVGTAVFAVLAALFSTTISFTVTPGLGGACLGVSIWFYLVFREQGNRALSGLALSSGILAFVGSVFVSAVSVVTPGLERTSIFGIPFDPAVRWMTWSGAFQTFLAHPVFGKGLGLAVAGVSFIAPSDGAAHLLTDAHNSLLSVAGQAGILGVVPFVLICFAVVRRSLPLDLSRESAGAMWGCLGIAFIAAFVCQGFVGSFEDARHLWVLLGLVLSSAAQSSNFNLYPVGRGQAEA
ncbi:hypothetical protein BH10ACI3_BH10ACI3_03960 [soil metagenome]